MNRIRVIVAGIVGGIVMFMGGALMHMVFQTDMMFMKDLPREETVVTAIRDTVSQRGWYAFPARSKVMSGSTTKEEHKAYTERLNNEPSGIVIFNPKGGFDESTLMGTELVSNIAACMVLAAVLARVSGSKPTRIALATLLGVAAWMAIDVSYWNWYKFPDTYVLASLIEQAGCWFLSGTVITLVLGKHMIAAPIGAKV